jgi:hypothetical protein
MFWLAGGRAQRYALQRARHIAAIAAPKGERGLLS